MLASVPVTRLVLVAAIYILYMGGWGINNNKRNARGLAGSYKLVCYAGTDAGMPRLPGWETHPIQVPLRYHRIYTVLVPYILHIDRTHSVDYL